MWVPRVRRYFRTIRRLTSGTEWAGGVMTVANYTPHARSVSRSDNITHIHRDVSVTFSPHFHANHGPHLARYRSKIRDIARRTTKAETP